MKKKGLYRGKRKQTSKKWTVGEGIMIRPSYSKG